MENLTGFASGGAFNMTGTNNIVVNRLRQECPSITIFKCVSHSTYSCGTKAAKTLPLACEDLNLSIYSYFVHSTQRKFKFHEFQGLRNKTSLITACMYKVAITTSSCGKSLVEQWRALKFYFQSRVAEERRLAVENISKALRDQAITCLHFLSYILSHINNLKVKGHQFT